MKEVLQFGLSGNPGGIEPIAINMIRVMNKEKFEFDFIIVDNKIALFIFNYYT